MVISFEEYLINEIKKDPDFVIEEQLGISYLINQGYLDIAPLIADGARIGGHSNIISVIDKLCITRGKGVAEFSAKVNKALKFGFEEGILKFQERNKANYDDIYLSLMDTLKTSGAVPSPDALSALMASPRYHHLSKYFIDAGVPFNPERAIHMAFDSISETDMETMLDTNVCLKQPLEFIFEIGAIDPNTEIYFDQVGDFFRINQFNDFLRQQFNQSFDKLYMLDILAVYNLFLGPEILPRAQTNIYEVGAEILLLHGALITDNFKLFAQKSDALMNLALKFENRDAKKHQINNYVQMQNPLASENADDLLSNKKDLSEQEVPPEVQIDHVNKKHHLIGQEFAKNNLHQIISNVQLNSERKKRGLKSQNISMHSIFSGPPGTGKTTFARYFAQEIKKLGFLKEGHLVEVSRSDLVAEYLGQTAVKTTKVFNKSRGGILFIDEAYSIKNADDDSFGQECIDTIVKLSEDRRDDTVVILAGYEDEMREFLRHNPGLKSRFSNWIEFKNFTNEELEQIFDDMTIQAGLEVTVEARSLAIEEILRRKRGSDFGNGRSVRNIFERALAQQSARLAKKSFEELSDNDLSTLIYSDFTEDVDDDGHKSDIEAIPTFELKINPLGELSSLVGLQSVKNEIQEIADYLESLKIRKGMVNPSSISLHMVFSGNPGTGKTTVARILGKIYQNLGVLTSGHVIETDRSSLVAGFAGQTAIKTKEKIIEAQDGILFVDEAYTLFRGQEDIFGQEAIDTILKCMEDMRDKLIVIFAGYPADMQKFLSANPGLKSRIKNEITFNDYTTEELKEIASAVMNREGYQFNNEILQAIVEAVEKKRKSEEHFANARTLRNVLEDVFRQQGKRIVNLSRSGTLDQLEAHTIFVDDIKNVS